MLVCQISLYGRNTAESENYINIARFYRIKLDVEVVDIIISSCYTILRSLCYKEK